MIDNTKKQRERYISIHLFDFKGNYVATLKSVALACDVFKIDRRTLIFNIKGKRPLIIKNTAYYGTFAYDYDFAPGRWGIFSEYELAYDSDTNRLKMKRIK